MLDTNQIDTRYAKSGELNIAYQVFGACERDIVLIPGWADLGVRALKGVPDQWRLSRAVP
ncbi:hypothetical protein [Thioalkalivibrio sp. XN279]|uniref:hypothetical protein n=1 Tax=Thioalkalivibrio sp. XN279 TaxID=2714953 RepID=UPI00140D8A47|nr:hypothetical protein [Thioalkalivibrio sp. XN279]NHA15766.1 hypothetical protein [Thioalkalivibrio sp. XN279]